MKEIKSQDHLDAMARQGTPTFAARPEPMTYRIRSWNEDWGNCVTEREADCALTAAIDFVCALRSKYGDKYDVVITSVEPVL